MKIPKNIFQTWKTKDISDGFKSLTNTWKENNPDYTYFLFDNNDCDEFIKTNFEISVYNTYCKIIPGAFKADLWRYCVLYVNGGVYIDIDTICLGNIDSFLNDDVEFMTPIDLNNCPTIGTHNLFNCFIACVPQHPILLECIRRIVHNVENNIIPVSNLDFSGPGILGRATNTFLKLHEEASFIGKHGIINNIKFLKFESGIEYVRDIENNNILFQNKNGNIQIQEIYNNEIKKINHIDWGSCKNPIKQTEKSFKNDNEPTIVTMFYDIRSKEGNNTNFHLNRNINKYCELAKDFILKLPYKLIVFTDDEAVMNLIRIERKNYTEKTLIINKPFEETYYYKHLDRLKELQNVFTIINGHKEHETPMYIIVNNNKFDVMEHAIQINPFNSNHFIWMDFGINHVAKNTEMINDWIYNVPDKIKQLCINPYIENIDNKTTFQYIYHHIAGSLFSGSKENLLKYCELFKQKTEEIYNDNWYQIDEAVMTMVQRDNPDLFDLFYGDYQGLISNYLTPIHNIDLILKSSQKYINFNKTKQAYDILCYSLKYFENNPHNELIFNYIEQHIIVDYYNNNRLLLPQIIRLINLKKISNDNQKIRDLIERNRSNINFYTNKNDIW
jgi:hypothetical protein